MLVALAAATAAEAAGYLGPSSIVLSKDGRRLYVAELDGRRIAVVDAAAQRVIRSIAVPAEPTGMVLSPDGARLYVTCAAPESTVCELDAGSGALLASIPAGHTASGAAIAPDGRRLYVCNRFNDNVSLIDLAARKEIARVSVRREPCAAAATPDGRWVYVLNLLPLDRSDSRDVAAEVTLIDTATRQTSGIRLPNGSTSLRGLCVSPDGKYVYVVHILSRYQLPATQLDRGWMNTNALSIIDTARRKLLGTVLLDELDLGAANPWAVAATADGHSLVISHAGTHELSVIDAQGLLEKLARLSPLPPGEGPGVRAAKESPLPLGEGPGVRAAGVPSDLAFLVGLRRRIELRGLGPRGLAVAGSTVYVAEYFSDTLGVVDLDSKALEPVRQIALGPKPQPTIERRGEMLFNDGRLCFQHWQSCATCHPDARVDGLNWDLLNDGLGNPKNTRTMVGAHRQGGPAMSLGVRDSAEAAVRAGILHILFTVRPEEDARAIDAYLKSLDPLPSPHLLGGKLSPAAERGKRIFFDPQVGCGACHPEPLYTDKKAHDVRSAGRFDKPGDRFNTPRLVEVWRTAPYMHDGRYLTIRELLTAGKHGASQGDLGQLSDEDIRDLAEFVLSL